MGLLSRLWNLNTKGCNLQEPLRSMIDSNKYKTMDVVGFLKSILEDARPYARMKLMIVGVQGIGKTSLLEQLRQEGMGSYKKKPVEVSKLETLRALPAVGKSYVSIFLCSIGLKEWVTRTLTLKHPRDRICRL